MTYLEVFAGGGSIILNKERSTKEVINDIDKPLISIFKAMRDEPKELLTRLRKMKYSENTFQRALKKTDSGFTDYVDQAVNEFTLRRMSRTGGKKVFSPVKKNSSGKNTWTTMLKLLPKISERLQNVTLLSCDFREVVKIWDEPEVFMYLDPPSSKSKDAPTIYDGDMTEDDHIALLSSVKSAKAKVMISGSYSSLYAKTLDKTVWRYKKKDVGSKSKERRTEFIWMNY